MDNVTLVRIFVSSPMDAVSERKIICEEIHKLNKIYTLSKGLALIPYTSEDMFSQTGNHPQELVNRQLVESCDALIACFKNRFGTPTLNYGSGTEEEIEIHKNLGNHVAIFFSANLDHELEEVEQIEALQAFKTRIKNHAYYEEYTDEAHLRSRISTNIIGYVENLISEGNLPIAKSSIAGLFQELQSDFSKLLFSLSSKWNVIKDTHQLTDGKLVASDLYDLLIQLGSEVASITDGRQGAFLEDINLLAKEAYELSVWTFTMGGARGAESFISRMTVLLSNLDHLKSESWANYVATSIPN